MTAHPATDSTYGLKTIPLAHTLQFVRDSGVEASVEQIQALELFISRRYSEWENGGNTLTPNELNNELKRIFGDKVSFYR